MYHKFAFGKLPGGLYLCMAVILPVLAMAPDAGMAGGSFKQFAAASGARPAARPTQQGDGQVRLARGVFLVARESMPDPNFARTVLLITEYRDTGTVGLVLNRPLDRSALDILPELKQLDPAASQLYLGGPVRLNSLRLLVRTDADLGDYPSVIGNVFQIDDLQGMRSLLGREPGQFRVRLYAGYAGWYPGQLEREMLRGDWLLARADAALIFTDDPASLWEKLIEEEDTQWVGRDRSLKLSLISK